MSILSLGYLRLTTPDLDGWDRFATEVLGFMPAAGTGDGRRAYRWDDHPYRLQLSAGEAADVSAIGWEVGDDGDLDSVVAQLETAGVRVTRGDDDAAADRLVSGFASFVDPAGAPVEIFHGPILDHQPLVTPLVSGFVTGAMGFGHVVIGVPDFDESVGFYRDVLGFHLRDTWHPGGGMSMAFLSPSPRHHSLALGAGMPGPLLRHFMVEAATIDDVGYAQDRCLDAGVPVVMGLGRHTNDRMISFYCRTPDDFMVEFGWGGVRVDDPAGATTSQITKPSFWGHRPIPGRGSS